MATEPPSDSVSDELDARRRVLLSIEDESDRAAVAAVFNRVDWRRHHEVTGEAVPLEALYYRCTDPACPAAWAFLDPHAEHWHPRR